MPEKQPEPRYLAVGRVLRPHGVHGELRVEVLTDFPEHLVDVQTVYVGQRHRPYQIAGMRFHRDVMLLTLAGCTDRNTAEMLRGQLLEVALDDAIPLEEDEYYHFQILGMQVETDEGELLGEIVDIFEAPGANDVLVVHGPRGEVLLPVITDVVLDINLEAQRMLVHLLPGLL